jgi:hypothetical protein
MGFRVLNVRFNFGHNEKGNQRRPDDCEKCHAVRRLVHPLVI